MAYFAGVFSNYIAPAAAPVSGVATVQYQVRDANGVPSGPVLTGVQVSSTLIQPSGFPAVPAIVIGNGAGQAATSLTPYNPSVLTEIQGAPSAAPADTSVPSFVRDSTTENLWTWDVVQQAWIASLVSAEASTNIPKDVWTNVPAPSWIISIQNWEAFESNGDEIGMLDKQINASGWPQIRSLEALSNVRFRVIGQGQINP